MRNAIKILAIFFTTLVMEIAGLMPVLAQSSAAPSTLTVAVCGTLPIPYLPGKYTYPTVDVNGNLCSGVTASISGFAPGSTGTPITATTGGATGTLPAGAVVVVTNAGTTNTAYCALGGAANTSSQPIAPNDGWFAFTVGAATQLTCATSTSTTTVNMTGGAGLPTGTGGGGGGGSGGGGAVTAALGSYVDGSIVNLGVSTDAASCASGTSALACWRQIDADIKNGAYTQGAALSGSVVGIAGKDGSGNAQAPTMSNWGAAPSAAPVFDINAYELNSLAFAPVAPATATATKSVLIGGQYNATAPTFTDGQQGSAQLNQMGKVIVEPYAKNSYLTSGVTAAMTGTTSTSLLGAPSGSLHNYLTHIICTNSHATVGTFVLVQDGSGGTTIYEAYAVAVGGGFSITLPAPLRQPTAATALYVQDVTTGANVICSGSGFQAL